MNEKAANLLSEERFSISTIHCLAFGRALPSGRADKSGRFKTSDFSFDKVIDRIEAPGPLFWFNAGSATRDPARAFKDKKRKE